MDFVNQAKSEMYFLEIHFYHVSNFNPQLYILYIVNNDNKWFLLVTSF